jgi:hypothetical protein
MRNTKTKPDFPSENPAFVLWQTTSLLSGLFVALVKDLLTSTGL